MAFFRNIQLTQFRNYQYAAFDFTRRIIAVSGLNGSGKTNLLDAIYYMCFTKSAFSRPDGQNVRHGDAGFRIGVQVDCNADHHKITAILRETGKKEFALDDVNYKKMSQHIGFISCVLIAPDDIRIIAEGSEERRKLLDAILCQLDKVYMEQLMLYNRILQQRNSLLRRDTAEVPVDTALLDIYDMQLAQAGQVIYDRRKDFLDAYTPLVAQQYRQIAGASDGLRLEYKSKLHLGDMAALLRDGRQKDILSGRSNYGIHKDDLDLWMGDLPFKNIASQGQRKSLLFALKLAEYIILTAHKGEPPLLLLDDVFEKLDAARMHNLLQFVCVENQGQVFITDTHAERLRETFEKLQVPAQEIFL